MAKPVSISLSKFTSSVQAAVESAMKKHPKFKLQVPSAVSVGFLIRGIPVPEEIASAVTLAETQALATDLAGQLGQAHPEALGVARQATPQGTILSIGRHVILGFPVPPEIMQLEK
jgi:hypothetical protein